MNYIKVRVCIDACSEQILSENRKDSITTTIFNETEYRQPVTFTVKDYNDLKKQVTTYRKI